MLVVFQGYVLICGAGLDERWRPLRLRGTSVVFSYNPLFNERYRWVKSSVTDSLLIRARSVV